VIALTSVLLALVSCPVILSFILNFVAFVRKLAIVVPLNVQNMMKIIVNVALNLAVLVPNLVAKWHQ
jgi:hypothetical protein